MMQKLHRLKAVSTAAAASSSRIGGLFRANRNFASLTNDIIGESEAASECMILEDKYGAHNYHPVSSTLFSVWFSPC